MVTIPRYLLLIRRGNKGGDILAIKRVILIAARTGNESNLVPILREPLGGCYISAYLREHGYDTKVIHQVEATDEELLREVKEFQPDVVGFSSWTYNYQKSEKLARRIKSEYSDIPVVFGGDHASACPNIVKDEGIDFAVIGEGEVTTLELLKALNGDMWIENVDGIAYIKNGEIKLTKPRTRITNLDKLPFPDRKDLPMEKYRARGANSIVYPPKQRLGTQHTSRGCRFRCIFCATPITWPGKWRSRSPKNIIDETEQLIDIYHVERIFFCDEDFMNDLKRVYQICDQIKERKLKFNWFTFARVTDVNRDILRAMKDAGCSEIFYGIESLSNSTLNHLHKSIKKNHITKALEMTREVGMNIWGTYMIGHPWEDKKTLLSCLKDLKKFPLDYLYLTFLTPFPGTPLYDYCKQNNLLLIGDFEKFDCTIPVIKTKIPTNELRELYHKFYHDFYNSPEYIIRMLEKIEKKSPLAQVYRHFFEFLQITHINSP